MNNLSISRITKATLLALGLSLGSTGVTARDLVEDLQKALKFDPTYQGALAEFAAGQKGVKLDWFATWRNWIRNSKQRKAGNGKPAYNGNATGQQDRSDPALENIFRLAGLGQASGNVGR